jgi:hypothetical protein
LQLQVEAARYVLHVLPVDLHYRTCPGMAG